MIQLFRSKLAKQITVVFFAFLMVAFLRVPVATQPVLSLSPASLTLQGCVMGGLICRTQTWTRAN